MSTVIKSPLFTPEIWGGIECTVNRVGDEFRDQLVINGHYIRKDDISKFSQLGIRKMRYPVLWENHLENIHGDIDWSRTAMQLDALRAKNIIPIAGLLHHGSGPENTNLMDDDFPMLLAQYAGRVATRFPWIDYYTPVNEPLTTARFSGLYGFWYPHRRDAKSFLTMLLNQVKAIVLSMKAIRRVNPDAKLIQTEDLSKTHSTPVLAYQAEFENHRRWLTCDLLCGKVTPGHPMWDYFIDHQINASALTFFTENTCPPFIIGQNYYVTSERFLDEGVEKYETETHGGNGTHIYADIAAVRVHKMSGLETLLREAWERYQLPLAITECYLNCTREEQMRWLHYVWSVCCEAGKHIPLKGLTAWSLTGSTDWDTLLLEKNNRYECGVYDVRQGDLRPTILAEMLIKYAQGDAYIHPLLSQPGWWDRRGNSSVPPFSVLLLCDDPEISAHFSHACSERTIGLKIINPDQTTENGISASLMDKSEKYWSIIYVLHKGSACAFIPVMENTGLPALIMNTTEDPIKDLPRQFLQISCSSCLSYDVIQSSLDLLIDKEDGCWELATSGFRKITLAKTNNQSYQTLLVH